MPGDHRNDYSIITLCLGTKEWLVLYNIMPWVHRNTLSIKTLHIGRIGLTTCPLLHYTQGPNLKIETVNYLGKLLILAAWSEPSLVVCVISSIFAMMRLKKRDFTCKKKEKKEMKKKLLDLFQQNILDVYLNIFRI